MAVESWLRAPAAAQTEQEADFVAEALGVAPPARLLDVPCGGGRHSHALADRGYAMTGVDLSADFLAAAGSRPVKEPGSIRWEHREMRELPWPEAFDGAYCLGNSFGYLDEGGNAEFLMAVARVLKTAARFVLETSYVMEVILPTLQERAWYETGDLLMLAQRRYDPATSRLHVEYRWIRGGETETRSMSARLYSHREIQRLLNEAGFTEVRAFGSFAREPFQLGSRQLLMIASKAAAG